MNRIVVTEEEIEGDHGDEPSEPVHRKGEFCEWTLLPAVTSLIACIIALLSKIYGIQNY